MLMKNMNLEYPRLLATSITGKLTGDKGMYGRECYLGFRSDDPFSGLHPLASSIAIRKWATSAN